MNKIFAAVLCGTILGLGLIQASAAASFADSTPQLRLRLKNDFRRASKPSAGANENIYAWVQGAMLEFDTGWYNDLIAVEGGGFWVQKLDSHDGKHTRWYLNSDDESFGYVNAALKVRLGDYGIIKAGRFVTDTGYGAQPYWVPLITSNSNRTLPTSSQGVLATCTVDCHLEANSHRYRAFCLFMALMITTKSLRVIAGTAQRAVLGGCLLKGGTRPYRSRVSVPDPHRLAGCLGLVAQ